MKNQLLTVLFITMFIVLLKSTHCHGGTDSSQRCLQPDEAANNLSCTFGTDWCGWLSDEGVSWKIENSSNVTYATLVPTHTPENFKIKQFSPWLCPTEHGVYSFRFRYFLFYMYKYSISLLLSTKEITQPVRLWTSTAHSIYTSVGPINIKCQDTPFQIYFEVEQDSTCSGCLGLLPVFDIDVQHVESARMEGYLMTCPSSPPSTPPSSSTADEAPKDKNISGCLAGDAVAGIVIGVSVLVVLIVVLIVLIMRSMGRINMANPTIFKQTRQGFPSSDASPGAFDGYEHTPGSASASRNATTGDESIYELDANSLESGNYYSAADSVTIREPALHPASTPTGDESDEYNELSFAAPRDRSAGTYGHLGDPGIKKY